MITENNRDEYLTEFKLKNIMKRRNKINKEITPEKSNLSVIHEYINNHPGLQKIATLAIEYMLYIEIVKKNCFNPSHLILIQFSPLRNTLMVATIEEYLEMTLSLTHKEMGVVNEAMLKYILFDTPITMSMFELVKYKYAKYLNLI